MGRRQLTMDDRAQIAVGIRSGWSDAEIGEDIGRHPSVVWREHNSTKPESTDAASERVVS